MRVIGFSLVAAAIVAACGPKPDRAQQGVPVNSGQPVFLSVQRQIPLQTPSAPWGTSLKIETAPNGDFYILDVDHHRIVRFAANGTQVRQAGGLGTGALQFDRPIDFDSDGLAMWVLDRQNQRLVRLDLALNFVEQINLEPDPADPTSALWYDAVAGAVSGEIVLLDRAEPKAISISPSGDLLNSYGGFGLGSGRLTDPTALATAQNGHLYVADGTRLLHYDRTGNLKQEYRVPQPITAVAAGRESAWVVTRSGTIHYLVTGQLLPTVVDPAASYLDPVAIDVNRDDDLVVLDRELSVWVLEPPPR